MTRTAKTEITLELQPRSRIDVINVAKRIREEHGDFLHEHRRAHYCSYHTTAGYFEESLCSRLNHDRETVLAFVRSFQKLFPPNANYQHDQLHLRTELSEWQRWQEPRNADSHLTFISSGLSSSVTYTSCPDIPVFLIDLDGIYGQTRRRRQTTVIGFSREEVIGQMKVELPVSHHPIDSVSLKDPRVGLFEQLQEEVNHLGIDQGRIDIRLASNERHAGLTVNEYETLLMKHDLIEVLKNPLRFMAEKGKHMLEDPRAIPVKAKDYAKYDLVQLVNEFVDLLGLNGTFLESIIDKFLAVPAERFLRMKRSVSLPVFDLNRDGQVEVIQGAYQSPILVQWRRAENQTRRLVVSFVRFA